MLLEKRIPIAYIVRKAGRDGLAVIVIAALIELAVHFNRQNVPVVPVVLPAFLGTAISLLLSFKLSQSYDRWWEARKIWGAIVNDSRTLVRQALTFTEGGDEAVRRLARRQIAWCYCLGQSLRGLDWKWGSEDLLSPSELAEAGEHTNKPVALLQFHAREVRALAREGRLTDYQRVAIDATLSRLTDSMGKAERIRNTVFPKTYRVFLRGIIFLFITMLSIALAEIEGAWQLAITTVVALPFLLLEKTATHMQDPFANRPTDTSVTAIARTIDINIRQLVSEGEIPEPWPAQDFYVM